MRSHSLTAFDIKGVGIGVPSPVLNERYVIPCVNLNHWGGFDVAHALSKRIGAVVKVENDANLAALVEIWQGSAKDCQSLVFITLGTGVGSGIVIDNKIIPRLGRYKLPALNRAMVQRFVNSLTADPLGDSPVFPKTVKNIHGTLNRLLNQTVDIDYLRVNPATKYKLPRIEKVQARALDKQEMIAFQKHIEGHRFEHEYLLALYTGLRESELLGLK